MWWIKKYKKKLTSKTHHKQYIKRCDIKLSHDSRDKERGIPFWRATKLKTRTSRWSFNARIHQTRIQKFPSIIQKRVNDSLYCEEKYNVFLGGRRVDPFTVNKRLYIGNFLVIWGEIRWIFEGIFQFFESKPYPKAS